MFNYQRPFAILYYRSLAALRYMGSAESISSACLGEDFFLRRGGMAQPYFVYGKPCQRSMRKKDYQEALRTPGISPLYASVRKQIRHTP